MSLISKNKLDLRKQILLELHQTNKELSYDELVNKLEIKIRKRLTDSMTILRKRMFIDQADKGVKISKLGSIYIKNFLEKNPL
jgi:hypothetical protein|tara:strand:+ start:1069 stop:1317 length:249 start_codon:yes stop_codon:yes gene_type:complete